MKAAKKQNDPFLNQSKNEKSIHTQYTHPAKSRVGRWSILSVLLIDRRNMD